MAPSAAMIRHARTESPKTRARDFAHSLGLAEADLLQAHLGHGATAISADPSILFPRLAALGDVMALTRNSACVHERKGVYHPFHAGSHAAMVLGPEIDLRIFPKHWQHGFAMVEAGEDGPKRSLQFFDAAGDAVHKIHLIAGSDIGAFDGLVADLAQADQSADLSLALSPRRPVDPPRERPEQAKALAHDWAAMTDTHQFLDMVKRHGMNRLGANRVVGAPHARRLAKGAVQTALDLAARSEVPVMVFTGNLGCIQIHSGLIRNIVPMGPWINVMDPRFNLHLRTDLIAEAWHVIKPTATGDAVSVEAFDAAGELIVQIFAYRKDRSGDVWNALVAALPHDEVAHA